MNVAFVGRGTVVLPQGGLIHWGCCLEMFYNPRSAVGY